MLTFGRPNKVISTNEQINLHPNINLRRQVSKSMIDIHKERNKL